MAILSKAGECSQCCNLNAMIRSLNLKQNAVRTIIVLSFRHSECSISAHLDVAKASNILIAMGVESFSLSLSAEKLKDLIKS